MSKNIHNVIFGRVSTEYMSKNIHNVILEGYLQNICPRISTMLSWKGIYRIYVQEYPDKLYWKSIYRDYVQEMQRYTVLSWKSIYFRYGIIIDIVYHIHTINNRSNITYREMSDISINE